MKANNGRPLSSLADRFSAFSRRAWLYALLLGGASIFMWPFFWMLMTSFKVDRELFSRDPQALPITPIPAKRSPWIDQRVYQDFQHPRLEAMLPRVTRKLETLDIEWPAVPQRHRSLDLVAKGVLDQLVFNSPSRWWTLPEEQLWRTIEPEIDLDLANFAITRMARAFAVGQLVARSYDLEEEVLIPRSQVAEKWQLSGDANAQFLNPDPTKQGQILAYDFSEGRTVRLLTEQRVGFPLERLHRIQLFIQPDDSWHAIECHVEMKGTRFQAERAKPAFDTAWQPITLQERGPDDLTNKKRDWLVLEPIDAGPQYESRPGYFKLEVSIRQSNLLQAWIAKISRNYYLIFDSVPFFRYVSTSLFIVILQIIGTIFSCSLVAYSFARLQWPGRSAAFLVMLATMMIPSQVTMIPQFLIIRELGWYNTLLPLWVPAVFANPFYVFLLYQFMKGIPKDLEAAARIDGCGALRIYWHVIMPLIRPSLAAIAIFTFMSVWNDFMGPLIYLSDQRLYPLSLGLYALNTQIELEANSMGIMMAGSILMTLPVILIFFFAQRYFIQGVSLSGIKG